MANISDIFSQKGSTGSSEQQPTATVTTKQTSQDGEASASRPQIQVDAETHRLLKIVAAQKGVYMKQLVRELVNDYVQKHQLQ